jgi:predicted CopG family antitoxin
MIQNEEDFVGMVIQWVKLDDKIRGLAQEMKEMKEEKKQYEEFILEFMNRENQDVLNISSGGTLRKSVSRSKGGIKEDHISTVLMKFTNDQHEASKITHAIMSDRPQTERVYLKRCNPRKKEI